MVKKMYRAGLLLTMSLMLANGNLKEAKAAEPYEAFTQTEEWEVLKETNKKRYNGGKEGISIFVSLQNAAHKRSTEIVSRFSHTRPNGKSCFSVLDDFEISYSAAGENIAAGQSSPQAVVAGWMNSSGHRANIMSEFCEFSHLGVGYKYSPNDLYKRYWIQLFVGGCTTTDIAMDTVAVETYKKGTSVDDMNRYLVITCDAHGVSYMPLTEKMCTGYNSQKTGQQTITVKYHNLSTSFVVRIPSETEKEQKVKKPGQITGLSVKKTSATKIKLTWKKKSSDGYEIYMKTDNGKYKKIKTIKNAKTTTYTVKKLKKGKKYTFKVRAYRLDGTKKVYGTFSVAKKRNL